MKIRHRNTLPLALQMAAEQTLLYGVILFDAVLAGQLGVDPLAAQLVVARLVELTAVLFQVTAIGGSILVAQAIGRGDRSDAELTLRSASLLSLAVGFAVMLLVWAISPLLMALMGVSGSVEQLGTPYMRALSLALPLQFLLLSANGCLRGAGDARRPLLVMGLANGLHVVLALLLVFALEAGLMGLALANFVSRVAGLLLLGFWLWRGTAALRWRGWQTSRRAMQGLMRLGTPVGLEQLAIRGARLLQLRLVTELGVAALAAYAVTSHTLSIILMLGLGFLLASLTLIGQLTGAGQTEHIYASAWQLQRQAWFVMGGLALLFFAWPGVTRLFSSDEVVRAAGPARSAPGAARGAAGGHQSGVDRRAARRGRYTLPDVGDGLWPLAGLPAADRPVHGRPGLGAARRLVSDVPADTRASIAHRLALSAALPPEARSGLIRSLNREEILYVPP